MTTTDHHLVEILILSEIKMLADARMQEVMRHAISEGATIAQVDRAVAKGRLNARKALKDPGGDDE